MMTKRIELMVAVHPGHGDARRWSPKWLEPRPHQRRPRRAQHRQRLVDGGVRSVQQRHLDRRRRALPADGRVHPGDQGAVDRSRFQFRRHILPRPCARGDDRRRGQGGHARPRRGRRQAEPLTLPADLCRQPFARRQRADRSALRRLVRRIQAGLPQLRRKHRAHGRRRPATWTTAPRNTAASFAMRSTRR